MLNKEKPEATYASEKRVSFIFHFLIALYSKLWVVKSLGSCLGKQKEAKNTNRTFHKGLKPIILVKENSLFLY